MQYPDNSSNNNGQGHIHALQVLAATASNERYNNTNSSSSESSSDGGGSGRLNTTLPSNSRNMNIMRGSHQHQDDGAKKSSQEKRQRDAAATASANNSSEDDDAGSRTSSGSSSGSGSGSDGVGKRKRTGLRKGKWTAEEEDYATRFIHHYSSGLLTLPTSKTLRASLAQKLSCDPMRITKKYAGASCLGNKISKLCYGESGSGKGSGSGSGASGGRPKFSPQDVELARMEIARLEWRFHLRLAQDNSSGSSSGVPLPSLESHPVTRSLSVESSSSSSSSTHSAAGTTTTAAATMSSLHTDQVHQNKFQQEQQQQQQLNNHCFPQVVLGAATTTASSAPSMPIVPMMAHHHQHHAGPIVNSTNAVGAPSNATTGATVSSYLAALASNAQLAAQVVVQQPPPQQQQMQMPSAQHQMPSAQQQMMHTAQQQQATAAAAASLFVQQQQQQQRNKSPPQQQQMQMHTAQQQQHQANPASLSAMSGCWPGTGAAAVQQSILFQDVSSHQIGVIGSPASSAASSPAISLSNNNDQLVQTLLLQITTQLQALATLSPTTLRQIQLQILAATTMPSSSVGGAPSALGTAAAAVPLSMVPEAATRTAESAAVMPCIPAAVGVGPADINNSALLANFQLAAATSTGQLTAHAGLATATAAALHSTANNGAGLSSMFPFAHHATMAAATPIPLLNPYGINTLGVPSVAAGAAAANNKNTLAGGYGAGSPSIASSQQPPQEPTQVQQVVHVDQGSHQGSRKRRTGPTVAQEVTKSQLPSSAVPNAVAAPRPISATAADAAAAPNNMAEFLNKLRQGHADALAKVQREQAELQPPVTKKQKLATPSAARANANAAAANTNNGKIVALLPFEHATTVSSGSGCTTNESSTSSRENPHNDGSTSSNSLSEEDADVSQPSEQQSTASFLLPSVHHRHRRRNSSVPLRKRFRSLESHGGNTCQYNDGGITRRNLADHNFRMAEEMADRNLRMVEGMKRTGDNE